MALRGRNRESLTRSRSHSGSYYYCRPGGGSLKTRGRAGIVGASLLLFLGLFGHVSALRCFSCTDCSAGGALSAQMQQCRPGEVFCAAIFRPRIGRTGYSSVDRGCASSIHVPCISDGTTRISGSSATVATENDGGGRGRQDSLGDSRHCCSTDLCNGSELVWEEGYRRSEEHLRDLMEGNPRNFGRTSNDNKAAASGIGNGEEVGGDGNSAQPARGAEGSRFATVLVFVGTFAQLLWLVGSLLQ